MKITEIDSNYLNESIGGAVKRGLQRGATALAAKVGNAGAQGLQRSQKMQKAMAKGLAKWKGQQGGGTPTFQDVQTYLAQLGFDEQLAIQAIDDVTSKLPENTTVNYQGHEFDDQQPTQSQGRKPSGKGNHPADKDAQMAIFANIITLATKAGKIPKALQKYLV